MTDSVSIGRYVLAGGELAAMVVADAVLRKLPGALGHADSALEESFTDALEGHPEYPTTPAPPRIAAGAYPMCSSPGIMNGCAAGASTAAASGVGLIMGALSYYSRPRATVLRSPLVDKAADWI